MIEKYSYCSQKQCVTFEYMLWFECCLFLCSIAIFSFIMQTHETHKAIRHSVHRSLIKDKNKSSSKVEVHYS